MLFDCPNRALPEPCTLLSPAPAGAKEGSPGPARSAPPRDQQKIEFRPAGPTEKRRRNPLSAAPSGLTAFRGSIQARRAPLRFALAPGYLLNAPSALNPANHR
jgi:hypothetical protein